MTEPRELCDCCKNKLPFDLPTEIIEAIKEKRLVVFAGAGISTEAKDIFIDSLYDEFRYDLKLDDNEFPEFPDLISAYCQLPEGRKKFLQKVKFRFDYVQQFRELYRRASHFHEHLAPIHQIDTIITTNWDDYFEKVCGAIPIVTPEDFAFFDFPGRKVFKIHGSINNIGSIIASKEDYDKCYKSLSKGIIGSYLKMLLATKVVLFIGYSFRDFDFVRIYNFIKKEMKELLPHSYFVTLDNNVKERLNSDKISIIKTDGCFFMETLKNKLIEDKLLIDNERLGIVYTFSDIIKTIHHTYIPETVNYVKSPQLIYNTFYQDGFIHALDFLIFRADSGVIFDEHFMSHTFHNYERLKKEKIKNKVYHDIAYIDGYLNGLFVIMVDEVGLEKPPFFYFYGYGEVFEKEDFEKLIPESKDFHKTATKWATRYVKEIMKNNNEIAIHHTPFL
jgi:NAD-dependent SIR2 family protein deacetylase